MKDVRDALTVLDFCQANRISRASYYNLRKRGHGPREMKAGRRTLISPDALEDWRIDCERRAERCFAEQFRRQNTDTEK